MEMRPVPGLILINDKYRSSSFASSKLKIGTNMSLVSKNKNHRHTWRRFLKTPIQLGIHRPPFAAAIAGLPRGLQNTLIVLIEQNLG